MRMFTEWHMFEMSVAAFPWHCPPTVEQALPNAGLAVCHARLALSESLQHETRRAPFCVPR